MHQASQIARPSEPTRPATPIVTSRELDLLRRVAALEVERDALLELAVRLRSTAA